MVIGKKCRRWQIAFRVNKKKVTVNMIISIINMSVARFRMNGGKKLTDLIIIYIIINISAEF